MNMHCIICANKEFKEYDACAELVACTHCGLVQRSTSLLDIETYYREHEEYERELDSSAKQARRLREVRRRLSLMQSRFSAGAHKKLLEVGCHEGLFLQEAKKKGFEVRGIEPNKKAALRAQENGIDVFCGMLEEFDTSEPFDYIVLFHVLEHFENPRGALEKINTLLVPGGLLVIEVPNIESFSARRARGKWEYITREHQYYFSPKTITNLLMRTGFRVLQITKKDFDEWHVSITENLVRLGVTKTKISSVQDKKDCLVKHQPSSHFRFFVFPKLCLRFFLVFIVKLLGRQNFILVFAKKP